MKKVDAFVTVEYALLLPVLYIVFAALIYIGSQQYNMCLLRQDVYFYAIEGEKPDYANKYILIEEAEVEERFWQMEQKLGAKKYSPQNILRLCKRSKNES